MALPAGHTGSSLFHQVLLEATGAFPDVFEGVRVPLSRAEFKRDCGDALVRFEVARVASARRSEIAAFMVDRTQAALCYATEGAPVPLAEYLAEAAPRPNLEYRTQAGDPAFQGVVPFGGRTYRGREVLRLVDRLIEGHDITHAAGQALRWIVEHIHAQGGRLDLRGHAFVLLGAGAELSPAEALLRAGATVLWVDPADPAGLAGGIACGGGLVQASGIGNLLAQPRDVVAAIEAFAEDMGPVHVGMFAYAAGESREWRLCAAMNAIVRHLRPGTARSVALLVSPTSVPTLQPETSARAEAQRAAPSLWKPVLTRFGLLPQPGHAERGDVRVGRCVVSIQGLSYQAAQYISKMAAAETFATRGSSVPGQHAAPLVVSANVAGITKTRSLSHPLFKAAFIGASRFGVRIFEPETTRALSGLLMLHDLLNDQAPAAACAVAGASPERAAALFSQQVHGGLFALPYVLEHAIRVSAVIGLGSNPGVLLRRPARPRSAAAGIS